MSILLQNYTGGCDGIVPVDCGLGTTEVTTKDGSRGEIAHGKNMSIMLSVNGKQVPLYSRVRTFYIKHESYVHKDYSKVIKSGRFVDPTNLDGFKGCYTEENVLTAEISEDYATTDTIIYFLDPRYDALIYKTVTERLDFKHDNNGKVEAFRETVGNKIYAAINIPVITKSIHTEWHFAVGSLGVSRLMAESDAVKNIMTDTLIIWPNPPSQATPYTTGLIFYDYNEYPGDAGWVMGRSADDGGKDFFWPEWCRYCGLDNIIDKTLRDDRLGRINYIAYARTNGLPMPDESWTKDVNLADFVIKSAVPVGNIQFDNNDNFFVSVLCDEISYNKLFIKTDDGYIETDPINAETVLPYHDVTTFYPVGII